jgi:hypothetical protein
MGMFAALAYPTDESKDDRFITQIEKKFGGILENDLVTTAHNWKKWAWAYHVGKTFVEGTHGKFDFPLMFGDLNARLFVLDKPRVLVIALKGTTSVMDMTIDLDFSTGHFVALHPDREHNTFDLSSVPDHSKLSPDTLTGDNELMTVHRGFLRAAKTLQPGIVKLMHAYFEKYDIQEVFITGHSLGAALAQLLAIMIPRLPVKDKKPMYSSASAVKYKNPNAYMFASPAVGDERFQRQFSRWSGESAQVWIDGDVVVTLPPFLLPDRNQSLSTYNDAINTFRLMSEEGPWFAGLLWALHEAVEHFSLPPQFDLSDLFKQYKTFDKRKVGALALEIANAANENQALRGGEVFMRLSNLHGTGFTEATYDMGNSETMFHKISTEPNIKEFIHNTHKIENIVGLMSAVAGAHPDLFELDAENIPSWADSGTIDPSGGGGGGGGGGGKVPRTIAQQLRDGTAHIVGYGKSAHHHKPWTMVPKEDIVQESGVWMGDDTQIINGLEHARSVKRRKIDKGDHTYRGHDYI